MHSTCRTAIGLRVKDGIVLAVEKIIHSKLLVPDANRRIQNLDKHLGMVCIHILDTKEDSFIPVGNVWLPSGWP